MKPLPALYIPHGGGPCFFMDWNPKDEWDDMAEYLRTIPAKIGEKPKALLVISAHWEEPVVTIQRNAAPDLLFDYYGFPDHTYQLTYPAPGHTDLSDRIAELLNEADIENRFEEKRGFDHGVFIPLKVAFPDADIPIVQVSLRADLDPSAHLALGQALSPLRNEGVLIIGSGMSYHNMQVLMARSEPGTTDPASRAFDTWLSETLAGTSADKRNKALQSWSSAPSARVSHPREEHLLPLHVVAGAAQDDPGQSAYSGTVMGVAVSGYQFG